MQDAGGAALFLRVAVVSASISVPIAAVIVAVSFVLVHWHNAGFMNHSWCVFSQPIGRHSAQEVYQHFAGFLFYVIGVFLVARRYVAVRAVHAEPPPRCCVECGYPCEANARCPECGQINDGRASRILFLSHAHRRLAATRFWIVIQTGVVGGLLVLLFAPLAHGLWNVFLVKLGLRSAWTG
jgi:hypothetical protein